MSKLIKRCRLRIKKRKPYDDAVTKEKIKEANLYLLSENLANKLNINDTSKLVQRITDLEHSIMVDDDKSKKSYMTRNDYYVDKRLREILQNTNRQNNLLDQIIKAMSEPQKEKLIKEWAFYKHKFIKRFGPYPYDFVASDFMDWFKNTN